MTKTEKQIRRISNSNSLKKALDWFKNLDLMTKDMTILKHGFKSLDEVTQIGIIYMYEQENQTK